MRSTREMIAILNGKHKSFKDPCFMNDDGKMVRAIEVADRMEAMLGALKYYANPEFHPIGSIPPRDVLVHHPELAALIKDD